ncbi:solute carrier family 2, facilitated glucose transporter member 3-like [Watersipora subatra]|uniref:solute carrier family 2, facilitated glucose transporter member 3-like n=1 Tax=Watersipora subatra TaxID=2589382 RepID=UPI00355B38DF
MDQTLNNAAGRLTVPLAITAFFAALGNSFTHGYNTGVLNSPSKHIRTFLNESVTAHYSEPSEELIKFLWSLTVSIYLVGGCAGAFSAGFLADRFGRKKAIILMVIPGLIGDALFGFCQFANSLEMLIIGRLIVGFSCGAGSGLVPMYLTEIAPVNIRGAMGVLHQLALTIGILVSQLLGLRELLGSETLWPILLASSAVPFIACAIALPFYPDSPRWLLVTKRDEQAAKEALQRFRGEFDVEEDLREMRREIHEQEQEPAWTMKKLFGSRVYQIPLMLVSVLAVIQQLSGINMVFYYSDEVFLAARLPADYTQYANLGMGTINVIMTIISVVLVEKAGRRPLLLGGMIAMVIALVAMTLALAFQDKASWLAYVSILTMVVFVIGFAIGLGSIPQFIGAELFKQGPRPAAMSFAGLMNWLANFTVGISFPFIQHAIKEFCMLFFIGFLIIFGVVIWKYLPETKNKTFAEIYGIFKKNYGVSDTDENANEDGQLMTPMGNGGHTTYPESVKPLVG